MWHSEIMIAKYDETHLIIVQQFLCFLCFESN